MKKRSNLEKAKQWYLEELKKFEADEEKRLAVLHQPKVNLLNIQHYSAYYQGARMALIRFNDDSFGDGKNSKIYKDAVFKLITSDIRYMQMYLDGCYDICYRNHKTDKKGKLISCEAYFAEKVTIYKEL